MKTPKSKLELRRFTRLRVLVVYSASSLRPPGGTDALPRTRNTIGKVPRGGPIVFGGRPQNARLWSGLAARWVWASLGISGTREWGVSGCTWCHGWPPHRARLL